jgi:hypothetical protein
MIKIICIIFVASSICSCSSKPKSDLSEITQQVLEENQGIKIEFTPQHEIK